MNEEERWDQRKAWYITRRRNDYQPFSNFLLKKMK